MIVGYARTSSLAQIAGLEAQERELQAAGCSKIFREQVSSVAQRDPLEQALDYVREGEELVLEPFQRLIEERQLVGYTYDGFWAGMDTFKDKQELEGLCASGVAPWEVWKNGSNPGRAEP